MPPKKRGLKESGGGRKKQSRPLDLETREGTNNQNELEAALESLLPQMVEKAVKKLLPSFCIGASSSCSKLVDQNRPPRYKLRFMNGLDNILYTRKIICDKNGEPPKICIIANGQDRIHAHILSAKIRVVVLHGDFDEHNQEVCSSIVRPRDKTGGALLTGPPELRLTNGEAYLCGYTFVDNSKFVRSSKFRLGVMVIDDLGERVQEGITEPFIVMDRRSEGFKKHGIPSLNDEVWRLNKVGKNGTTHGALNGSGIFLVKDFLSLYYKDNKTLRQILIKVKEPVWTTIVENAMKCDPGPELYSFVVEGNSVMLFFNSVCQIVGAKFGDNYTPFADLEKQKKDQVVRWIKVAYKKMTYDQPDYEMDNGIPRPINDEMFQGLSVVEHGSNDPVQAHSAEANRNVRLPENQQGTSGSHSKNCEIRRLKSSEVTQNYDSAPVNREVQEAEPVQEQQPHDELVHDGTPLQEQQHQGLEQEAALVEDQQRHDELEPEAALLQEQQQLDELEPNYLNELENEANGLHEQQPQHELEQLASWQQQLYQDELWALLQEVAPLHDIEQEAAPLQEQQHLEELEQQAAQLHEQQHQATWLQDLQILDELEDEEQQVVQVTQVHEQQHQGVLEHQVTWLQDQQNLNDLEHEVLQGPATPGRAES